jgi:hypothetical protein
MALPGRTRSFGLSSNKMTRHGIVCVSSAPFRPSGAAHTDALDLSSRLLITRRGSVTNPLNFDLRARAELLTYLVASHLFARRMTGDWLSSDHVVESTRIWLATNDGGADLLQRVMLSRVRDTSLNRSHPRTRSPSIY